MNFEIIRVSVLESRETEHVKTEHLKSYRAHFRLHLRERCQISRAHSRGSLHGDPMVHFTQKSSTCSRIVNVVLS